jgi:adenylate cyclase
MEWKSMLGELVPCGGGDPIPLVKDKLLLGRRGSCDISLRFPNVSSHHCQLELLNGYWFVRDLNSRNGIKVNGVRCESKWLMPGDVLAIAKHRYELLYTPEGDAPPAGDEDPFSVSLLEKAGLLGRNSRDRELPPSAKPVPANGSPGHKGKSDDGVSMEWLDDPTLADH